jgi:hypothetical protein
MIGGAIYQLLNVPAITDLVEQLNYGLAPQENLFPRIVITERSTPENFKDGYSIINHDVEINIYASKAKDGNGGFLQASNIADAIETILYRYKGTVEEKRIDQTLLSNQEILFDNSSQCARVIMEYSIRENLIATNFGPTNTIAPVVTGITQRGETLITTNGTWIGIDPITYTYQWVRNLVDIEGATNNTYTLAYADDNAFISCKVIAMDDFGATTKLSNIVGPSLAAPYSLFAPIVSGTFRVGSTITSTEGVWQGIPTITFAYQWRRFGINIDGENTNEYTLSNGDYNTAIDCVVTATNSLGVSSADSNDAIIQGTIPIISGLPFITGVVSIGRVLTANAASASGFPTPTRAFQWQISNDGVSGWANIEGETEQTYLITLSDEFKYIRVNQIETNVEGTDTASSLSTTEIGEYVLIWGALSVEAWGDTTVDNWG